MGFLDGELVIKSRTVRIPNISGLQPRWTTEVFILVSCSSACNWWVLRRDAFSMPNRGVKRVYEDHMTWKKVEPRVTQEKRTYNTIQPSWARNTWVLQIFYLSYQSPSNVNVERWREAKPIVGWHIREKKFNRAGGRGGWNWTLHRTSRSTRVFSRDLIIENPFGHEFPWYINYETSLQNGDAQN